MRWMIASSSSWMAVRSTTGSASVCCCSFRYLVMLVVVAMFSVNGQQQQHGTIQIHIHFGGGGSSSGNTPTEDRSSRSRSSSAQEQQQLYNNVSTRTSIQNNNDLFQMSTVSFRTTTTTATPKEESQVWSSDNNNDNKENATNVIYYNKTLSTRQTMPNGVEIVVWQGRIWANSRKSSSSSGFATILRYSNHPHNVIASWTTDTTVYDIVTAATTTSSSSILRIMNWKDIPDGSAIELDDIAPFMRTTNINTTLLLRMVGRTSQQKQRPMATTTASIGQRAVTTTSTMTAHQHDTSQQHQHEQQHNVFATRSDGTTTGGDRNNNNNTIIDVLVLITNRAMCEVIGQTRGCLYNTTNAKPIEDKMRIAQAQTNYAMQSADIPASIHIVQMIHLDAEYDTHPDATALETLRLNPQIQQWMSDVGADLVSILTGSIPAGFPASGVAYMNRPESAISIQFLPAYTFTHEIGHNFGCRHNRGACPSNHPYAHALQVPNQFRTVMAYRCSSGTAIDTCPRIPFYSANGYYFDGIPLGDSEHDNARMIRETASRVAAWKKTVLPIIIKSSAPPTNKVPTQPSPMMKQPYRIRAPVVGQQQPPRAAAPKPTSNNGSGARLPPIKSPLMVRIPTTAAITTTTKAPKLQPSGTMLTCGTSHQQQKQCPGGQNLMKKISSMTCSEHCVSEGNVQFWLNLGRSCGSCT